jgi:hypothetical protein
MRAGSIKLIVSEYNILWEALLHYEAHLEGLSSSSDDEDKQLVYDEKLQDIEGMKRAIASSAMADYQLELK